MAQRLLRSREVPLTAPDRLIRRVRCSAARFVFPSFGQRVRRERAGEFF